MTKSELSELLKATGAAVSEGVTVEPQKQKLPRIDYWETSWEDILASDDAYESIVTYQVSLYARVPRCEELLRLRELLRDNDVHTTIMHEYIPGDAIWHSYCAVEVLEDE